MSLLVNCNFMSGFAHKEKGGTSFISSTIRTNPIWPKKSLHKTLNKTFMYYEAKHKHLVWSLERTTVLCRYMVLKGIPTDVEYRALSKFSRFIYLFIYLYISLATFWEAQFPKGIRPDIISVRNETNFHRKSRVDLIQHSRPSTGAMKHK